MQCEYITSTGQCSKSAIAPSKFCELHSKTSAQTMLNGYRIACKLLGDSPERHAQVDEIKNLRAEIALMRAMLERRLNMIESDAELAAAMPTLKDFAVAIQKLAESTHNMDVKLGNLLDKQALMNLAQEIIEIITRQLTGLAGTEVTQEQVDLVVESVGREIVQAIARKENQ